MKPVRTTASALKIRSLPRIEVATDTGKRVIAGQTVQSLGITHDDAWQFVEAPAGAGWCSAAYLVAAPPAPPLPRWPTPPSGIAAIRALYGDPRPFIRADGTVAAEWERRVTSGQVRLPASLPLSYAPAERVITIRCHPLIVAPLRSVYDQIFARGYWDLLRDYGGCYNFRNARGLKKLSTHCWAIAVDHDVLRNPLGAKSRMDPRIVAIFEDHGFYHGGNFSRPDGMHLQLATSY